MMSHLHILKLLPTISQVIYFDQDRPNMLGLRLLYCCGTHILKQNETIKEQCQRLNPNNP